MTAERQPPSKLVRWAISLLLIGHLLAVVLPPLSFQTRGPLGQSPSVATAFAPLEGYSQFMYVDRGYAFFAPDPGPSHLFQAAITEGNGQQLELMFPDREQQWPRLLYHRHFMLAEFLEEIYQPPGPPAELAELDPDEAEFWVRSRARYEHVRQSVVEHLKNKYPRRDVAIRRIEHLIPDLIEFREEPVALTHPDSYQVMLDLPIDEPVGDLAAPRQPPETIPPPKGEAIDTNPQTSSQGDRDRSESGKDSDADSGKDSDADSGEDSDADSGEDSDADSEATADASQPAEKAAVKVNGDTKQDQKDAPADSAESENQQGDSE